MANSSMVDRISGLPLPLLHHVLSCLPTHAVVRTCVLSKHWRNIWVSCPSLWFQSSDEYFKTLDDFPKYVEFVLLLRDGSGLQKLKLLSRTMDKLDLWILYAIRHNLQALDMFVYDLRSSGRDWKLPSNIFTCESLREFKLRYKKHLNLPSSICLPALKTLHLMDVIVVDSKLVDIVLAESPSLETLILENCDFQCSLLPISSCQLKMLRMLGSFPSVVISTPNLASLYLNISQESPTTIKVEGGLLSLMDTFISIPSICPESATHLTSVIKKAESLSLKPLSPFVLELVKARSELNLVETEFSNLKLMKIDTLFSDAELIWINNTLKLSPGIESVFLTNSQVNDSSTATRVQHCNDDKVWSKCDLSHLKIVELHGFRGSKNEIKMVRFFLENAAILDQIIIMFVKPQDGTFVNNQEIMKIGRELVKYPRASASVGILFAQTL